MGSADDFKPYTRDHIVVEQLRVGCPRLCRLPAVTLPGISSPLYKKWEEEWLDMISKIVNQHQVHYTEIGMVRRAWRQEARDKPDEEFPITILVWARRDDPESHKHWWAACADIRRFLNDKIDENIAVEIADPETATVTASFPILSTDTILELWPKLETDIVEVLQYTDCTTLNVLRRGTDRNWKENPVTVVITIPEESVQDWKPVRESIVEILDRNGVSDVAVEIGRGSIWQSGSSAVVRTCEDLPDDIWDTPAKGGASIGPKGSYRGSATLGGFLEIQTETESWNTFGITAYHAVVPRDPVESLPFDRQTLQRWHSESIQPGTPDLTHLKISQPSLTDFLRYVKRREDAINEAEEDLRRDNEIQRFKRGQFSPPDESEDETNNSSITLLKDRLSKAKEFVKSGADDLGCVWAGSGVRLTSEMASLDWALLAINPLRLSTNLMPRSPQVPERFNLDFRPTTTIISKTALPRMDEHLFKLGRTTGFTRGMYNGIPEVTLEDWREEDPGHKREIARRDHLVIGTAFEEFPFSDQGDSGAFILDRTGKLIGLLLGGNDHTSGTRFTLISNVFEDIKKVTGCAEVRLRL